MHRRKLPDLEGAEKGGVMINQIGTWYFECGWIGMAILAAFLGWYSRDAKDTVLAIIGILTIHFIMLMFTFT